MGHLHRFTRRTRGGLTAQAAGRSALLSALFLAVYGGCNWLAAQRTDVGVWYFACERQIPFWPAMIVPYLSIDAFFVAAPFLCRDREEMRLFTRRIVAAIAAAGVCFVMMPLRFAFDRPVAEGWLGVMFGQFLALDRPFNLVPSLHITLAVILADAYRRHTRGFVRVAVTAWFVLIGLSTVFTYQHHVIDVIGGLVLATVVFYVVRNAPRAASSASVRLKAEAMNGEVTNPVAWLPALRYAQGRPEQRRGTASAGRMRVALYYFTGAALSVTAALSLGPWAALLLWPALSLTIVGAGYGGL